MKRLLIPYLVLVHLALGLLLLKTDAVDRLRYRLTMAGHLAAPERDVAPIVAILSRFEVPEGATVLLGDSILDGAPWPCPNFAISGTRSDQLYVPPTIARAGAVVLSLGSNDLFQRRGEGLGRRVGAILARIDRPTYLLGISGKLAGVEAANRELFSLCRAGCTFVEPVSGLQADGIHLTPEAYGELRQSIPPLQGRCTSAAQSRFSNTR